MQKSSNQSWKCSKCNVHLPNRMIYQQHLRAHVAMKPNEAVNSQAEETARYIAERRKNFPTTDNINKKLKTEEERQERGDVLETRQFGRMKEKTHLSMRATESDRETPIPVNNYAKSSEKASLLERLLAADIRRERNMVLQCIRHIVNNDFYGLDEKKIY